MTRFVVALQAAPDWNEVGLRGRLEGAGAGGVLDRDGEWNMRARSAAAASRSRRTGRIRASSTIAWPADGRTRTGVGDAPRRVGAGESVGARV